MIKSGALNLEHSYKYRPLDDYLIDRVRWQRDKQHLIERAGLEALSQQYLLTNQNITEGKNPHIKIGKGSVHETECIPLTPTERDSPL